MLSLRCLEGVPFHYLNHNLIGNVFLELYGVFNRRGQYRNYLPVGIGTCMLLTGTQSANLCVLGFSEQLGAPLPQTFVTAPGSKKHPITHIRGVHSRASDENNI